MIVLYGLLYVSFGNFMTLSYGMGGVVAGFVLQLLI